MVSYEASDGSGWMRVLFHRLAGRDADDHAEWNKRLLAPLASADHEPCGMEREPFTNPKDTAHDIEQAHETVIESLKAQHPDWVDENGECARCVAYEYALADPATPGPEETK